MIAPDKLDGRSYNTRVNIDGDIADVVLTVKAPGVVVVTTPGERHVVVDHIPYYVDSRVQLFADDRIVYEREHIVFRFGANQADEVSAPALSKVRELVDAALRELILCHPCGFVALDDGHAAARFELAQLQSSRAQAADGADRERRKAAERAELADRFAERVVDLDTQIAELQSSIAERWPAASLLKPTAAELEAEKAELLQLMAPKTPSMIRSNVLCASAEQVRALRRLDQIAFLLHED